MISIRGRGFQDCRLARLSSPEPLWNINVHAESQSASHLKCLILKAGGKNLCLMMRLILIRSLRLRQNQLLQRMPRTGQWRQRFHSNVVTFQLAIQRGPADA